MAASPLTEVTAARDAVARVLPSVRADLEDLIRIRSVSADPAAAGDVRRAADHVAQLVRAQGFDDVQVLTVEGGRPAVVARSPAPEGAPTVLLYAHHDVQPTGPRDLWESDPFEPTERDGRLFARGAADDKAGIAAHLAALRAHGTDLPVGVTLLIEGEEEIGSPTLAAFLAAHGALLAADVIVLADGINWALGVPAVSTSLRGLVDVVVEVRTLEHAIHSGMYGGPIPDALSSLCRLLASLHDENGDVAVPGLVTGPSEPLDLTDERLRAEAGVVEGVELVGSDSLTARLWTRPAVSVLAIDAPRVSEAANVLVPSARAMVSLRVPPGMTASAGMDALVAHLEAAAPWGAQVTVTRGVAGEPFAINATGPAFDVARRAFADAWGREPVDIGVGGTIPFVAAFADAFPGAAILVTGVEDPDSRAHGANESLHLGEFERVCLAETLLLARVAAMRDDRRHGTR